MIERQHTSYSKCFKPKEGTSLLPDYLVFLLKNKTAKKPTNYRQYYKK